MENTRNISILEIFLGVRARIEATIYRRVRCQSTTSDLTQETFLRLWERRDWAQAVPDLSGYFVTTGRNLAIDHLRRARISPFIQGLDGLENLAENDLTAEDVAIHRQELQRLQMAITKLPPRAQAVFILARIEGLTYAEIGKRLGISHKTAFSHMVAALDRLRQEMQRD